MEINEILNKVADNKATVKIVDDMLEITIKQWNNETGKIIAPKKEYLSILDLQAKRNSLNNKLQKIIDLLTLVNL